MQEIVKLTCSGKIVLIKIVITKLSLFSLYSLLDKGKLLLHELLFATYTKEENLLEIE